VKEMAEALMSAEADAVCGVESKWGGVQPCIQSHMAVGNAA
jgi:hypothetical protein